MGSWPPHVMVYFAMAPALFAEEDYEEVAAQLTETLASWGCWDESWSTPTSGGITQARKRLGPEPLELLFDQVAVPVAGELIHPPPWPPPPPPPPWPPPPPPP
jgi:Insertion element 4 transposase N-terminal